MSQSSQSLPLETSAYNGVVQDYLDFMLRSATEEATPIADAVVSAAATERPRWAEGAFACLQFRVAGLPLVAPLTELGGIAELASVTPVFAQASWFMGLMRWNGRNLKVVDTARLIMPERVAADEAHRGDYRCVLVLDGSDWALAIDAEAESLRLEPEQICWRSSPGSRPWQAGTVAERLCPLLDVRVLARSLGEHATAEQSQTPVQENSRD